MREYRKWIISREQEERRDLAAKEHIDTLRKLGVFDIQESGGYSPHYKMENIYAAGYDRACQEIQISSKTKRIILERSIKDTIAAGFSVAAIVIGLIAILLAIFK